MKKIGMLLGLTLIIFGNQVFAGSSEVALRFEQGSLYGGNAQIELLTSEGVRVLFDISDPSQLSSPPTRDDVLLITHRDNVSSEEEFIKSFPGKILDRAGEIKLHGIVVHGIASSHTEGQPILDQNGSNYIFLIETGGMRIANFGNIGQKQLTPDQLNALGRIDIALAPIYNINNYTNLDNLKGFNLMDQVQPKIVIPTSFDFDTARYAVEKWQGFYWDEPELRISRDKLPGETQVVILGKAYGKAFKIPKASY